jgi:CubicO group peptidase (beta-lactamase class C family)
MRRIGIAFLAGLAAGAPAVAADRASRQPLAALVAGPTAAGPQVMGLAVASADARGVRWSAAHGWAVAGERPMRADTAVRVASISKLVVVLTALRLEEEGRLDLDRDVSDYLGFRLRHPAHPHAPITLRHLIGHRSGVSDANGYRFPLGTSLADGLGTAAWGPAAPGKRFDYANIGFGIIATALERVSGERFDLLAQRLILTPMRLDACFNWSGCSDALRANAAALYRKGRDETAWDAAGPWVVQVDAPDRRPAGGCPVALPDGGGCDLAAYVPGTNGTLFSPQGGLRISVEGLAAIGAMLLADGQWRGRRILSKASVEALFAAAPTAGPTDAPPGETYRGLMARWGLTHCLSGDGAPGGDQPLEGRASRACGHLGEAYGLYSGLWVDRAAGRAWAYALTGTADNPERWPGARSRFLALEEALLGEAARR